MKRQASQYCKAGDYYSDAMAEAVKHPLWDATERLEMIENHHAREYREAARVNCGAGRHLEKTA